MYHFCTYFDSGFLVRALALHQSLLRHAQPFVLHALCLDKNAHDTIVAMNDPNLRPISLDELEEADPRLAQTKRNRSTVEYYFTCTPALPRHVLRIHPEIDAITYLDADLYFFAGPGPIYQELGDESVAIIRHRFASRLRHFERYGVFNVGLLVFRNDQRGRACLNWWHEQCLNWCYDRVEPHRFADQKYLDVWPDRFEGVVELNHNGANLAPWNLENFRIREKNGEIFVDHDQLIFFHFHRLKWIGPGLYDHGFSQYGTVAQPLVLKKIYRPYLRELRSLMKRYPQSRMGNRRLMAPGNHRELIRTLIHGRSLLNVGPIAQELHLKPLARPLLRLRQNVRKAA